MSAHDPHAANPPDASRHEHETSDVNVRMIALFGAISVVFGVSIHFLLGALMSYFSDQQSRTVGATRPLSDILWRSSEPRLQVAPAHDLTDMRRSEHDVLDSYGWVDRHEGVVHVPIERAIDLTLERGLPTREQAPQQDSQREKK